MRLVYFRSLPPYLFRCPYYQSLPSLDSLKRVDAEKFEQIPQLVPHVNDVFVIGLVSSNKVTNYDPGYKYAGIQVVRVMPDKTLVLKWPAVADPVGLRGYRLTVAGMKPLIVRSPTVKLTLAEVSGRKITVVAVDAAGNTGNGAAIVARG